MSLGYTETKDSNGLVIHSGILTGPDYIPLGIAHQLQIIRDRNEFGKKAGGCYKDFDEKESHKWANGLYWAERFNHFIDIPVVQVGDRECDIASFFNLAFELGQLFLVRSMHDSKVKGSEEKLSAYIKGLEVMYRTERILLDRNGKEHTVECIVKHAQVHLKEIDQPMWAIYLEAVSPPEGIEQTSWTLLTNLPLERDEQMPNRAIDAYTKGWRTTRQQQGAAHLDQYDEYGCREATENETNGRDESSCTREHCPR